MSLLPLKICMNGLCGATTTAQLKRGWHKKVGGGATLCYACGYGSFCSYFTLHCFHVQVLVYVHGVIYLCRNSDIRVLNPHCCFKVAISFK
ncbi:hypothetical protein Hdeb2414_s0007g00237071 [Helianthus debilis subsp. tardiflorus]